MWKFRGAFWTEPRIAPIDLTIPYESTLDRAMPSPPLPLVQSLSPRIAILTSDDVIDSCAANGCAGLEELLRPWESSAEMGTPRAPDLYSIDVPLVQIMSSTLTPTKHPTFPLRFVSYSSVFPHPESSNPNPDIVVDVTSSLVGSKRPGKPKAPVHGSYV